MDEKQEIKSLLPETLPDDVKNAMILAAAKNDALGGREFLLYQRESWDNSFDQEIGFPLDGCEPRPRWAARCTCGCCGNTWHWGWKNASAIVASVGPDGTNYPGIPEDSEEAQEVSEDEMVVCPYCDNKVIAVSRASLKNGRTYRCLMGRVENLGKYTAVIYWMLERIVDREAQSTYHALPWMAVVIGEQKRIYRFAHTWSGFWGKRNFADHWQEQPHMGEPIRSRYYSWEACNKTMLGGFYVTDVPDQTGMTGEKTGLAAYLAADGEYPLAYLLRQKRRPALENLVKAGWTHTVDRAIYEELSGGAMWRELGKIADWTKTKPKEMLRLPKDAVERVGRRNWKVEVAALWQACADFMDVDAFSLLLSRFGVYDLRKATERFGADELARIDAYLQKQARKVNHVNMTLYLDYRRMLERTGGGETPIELYPPNLRAAHDRLTAILDAEESKDKDRAFAALREKWAALEWSDGSICAVLPRCVADLKSEGKTLEHCVGGYVDSHLDGKLIIFIRHARRPERSWYTLNVDVSGKDWHKVQLHGYGNEHAHGKLLRIPPEVRAFVDRWEQEVLTPVFRKVKEPEKRAKKKAGAA